MRFAIKPKRAHAADHEVANKQHSVSKPKARGRMFHELRKDLVKWQSTENLAEQAAREKHC